MFFSIQELEELPETKVKATFTGFKNETSGSCETLLIFVPTFVCIEVVNGIFQSIPRDSVA